MQLDQLLTSSTLRQYLDYLKSQGVPPATIDRKLASIRRFSAWARPGKKGSDPRVSWISKGSDPAGIRNLYQLYSRSRFSSYLHFAILVLFSAALAVFGYNQVFKEAQIGQAFPQAPSPTAPNRYLSFQARLTDSSDNPITTPTDMRFLIYNNETASGSAKLWEELRYVDPDQDGIFSVNLGTQTAIASSVFTENANLWLGVTVETDAEATPRQRIATVGYALNAETLQGFPPSASASADQIPVITQEGDLVLAAASPMVYSSSGTFAIKGQAMAITTDTGTNGSITLAPDGTGSLLLSGSTTTQNFIRATNANLSSGHLISGYVGNDTASGDLLNLSSGAVEAEKFTVDRSGNVALAGDLTITGGDILDSNGNESIRFGTTASAVNEATLTNAATAGTVLFAATGGDTDIALSIDSKGADALNLNGTATGDVNIAGGSGSTGCTIANATGTLTCTVGITAGAVKWNGLTVPDGNLTLAMDADTTTFNWDTLTSATGLTLAANTTGAASNTQKILSLSTAGANAASTQTTYGLYATNTHTGTASTNVGGYFSASGATNNYGLIVGAGNVGIGTTGPGYKLDVNGTFNAGTSNFGGNVQHNEFSLLFNQSGVRSWTMGTAASSGNLTLSSGDEAGMFRILTTSTLVNGVLTVSGTGNSSIAGNVGIGTTGPAATALLDLTSTTKGFLAPRMTTTQRDAITTPATGLFIYNTTTNQYNVFNGTSWGAVGGGGGDGLWRSLLGAISPVNDTLDVLIGNTATASAKFGFINVDSGTPTATIAGQITLAGGNRNIQTTAKNSLILGGDTTGDITFIANGDTDDYLKLYVNGNIPTFTTEGNTHLVLDPDGGLVGFGGFTYYINTSGTGNLNALTLAGTLDANGQIDLGDGGDTITLNGSSLTFTGFNSCTALETDGSGLVSCGSDADGSAFAYFRLNNGTLSPINDTWDLLVGSNATASAKFAVLNVNSGTPTASVSAGTTGAAYLTATGNLATTAKQSLTLGSSTTGNILLNPASNHFTRVQNNAGGQAAFQVDQLGSGDVMTASVSGATVFRVDTSGYAHYQRYADLANSAYYLDPAATGVNLAVAAGSITSAVADAATTVGFTLNTTNTLSSVGAKLLSIQNNSTEKMYLDKDGNLYVAGTLMSGNGTSMLLTNKSGGVVANRALVVLDSSNNSSFTTTTTPYNKAGFGVVVGVGLGVTNDADGDGACDANDICMIAYGGSVNVTVKNATTAVKGDYLFTSDTAGSAVASAKQYDGLVGIVDDTTNSASGYLKMIFKVQPQVTAAAAIDKGTKHNEYWLYADQYQAVGEGSNTDTNLLQRGLAFDTFSDSTKIDSANTTASFDTNTQKTGLIGGQTLATSTTDNDGQTYLGSNTVNDQYLYDRTRDSSPQVQVELGLDPNWYNGVTLSVATTSAQFSQNSVITQKNPNLSTSYNGSLIKVTGTDSTPRTIYITIKSPTTFDWTNYQGDAATGVTMTFGTAQALGTTGVSATFTNAPPAGGYNTGDVFKIASWFIEAESATRGAKQQFPERSNVIATASSVDIIDADTQKLWMRFSQGTAYAIGVDANNDPSSANMLNGKAYISTNGSAATGLYTLDFAHDAAFKQNATDYRLSDTALYGRNGTNTYNVINTSNILVNTTVNDVSAAVIPNLPAAASAQAGQPTQEVTVNGWGYMQGNGTGTLTENVNFPYKFNNLPTVLMTNAGTLQTTAPKKLSDCTSYGWRDAIISAYSTTTTNTNPVFVNTTGTISSDWYICYTWTATGQVSPRQYVGAATDAGVTVINETDGTGYSYSDATDDDYNSVVLTSAGRMYGLNETKAQLEKWRDIASNTASETNGTPDKVWDEASTPALTATAPTINTYPSLNLTEKTSTINSRNDTIYVGTNLGASVIQDNENWPTAGDGSEEASGSVKYYTITYVTEEIVGATQGMWGFNSALTDSSVKAATITAAGATITYPTGVRNKGINITVANGTATTTTIAATYSMGIWVKETAGWTHYVKTNAGTYINGVLSSTAFTNRMTWATTTVTLVAGTQDVDEMFATNTTMTPGQIRHMYETGYRALQSHATTLGGGAADTNQQLGFISTGTNTVGDARPDWNNQYMYVGTNSTTLGAVSKIDLNSDTNIKTYNSSANVPTGGPLLIDEDTKSLAVGYNLEAVGSAASGVKTMGVDNNATATSGNFIGKTITTAESFTQAYLWAQYTLDASDASNTIQVWASNDGGSNYSQCNLTNTDTSRSPSEYEYFCQFNTPGSSLKTKFVMARGSTKTNTWVSKYGIAWIDSNAVAGSANGSGLFTGTNASVANGSYIDVAHNQNSNDLVNSGWVYNTTTSKWELIDNGAAAEGGTITTSGGYTIHTFTSSGTFTPSGTGTVEYLVVAGGGGGGRGGGGGGGAGGLLSSSSFAVSAQTYTVTVGAEGAGATISSNNGVNGGNSVFGSITTTGGSGGSSESAGAVNTGGSGGGGSFGSNPGGSGTAGQGNNGGNGSTNGGGGGGSSAVGANAAAGDDGQPGAGGAGTASSISGSSVTYASGGGAGGLNLQGNGGTNAGNGGTNGVAGTSATANRGGGGGGGGRGSANGGAGGSGIVIIRYKPTYLIQQTDANTVRLYNYSGSTQNLRLDVITGGLGRNAGTVSLAPAAADVDSQSNVNSLWINKTGSGGNLLKLQTNSIDVASISPAGNIDLSGIVFSAGGPKYFPIMYEGSAQTNDTFFNGFTFGKTVTITGVTISAKTAPTGSSLTVDLLKNGSVQSRTSTLAAGANSQFTNLTDTSYVAADTFGLKITGVGSTEAGRDMVVIVHYTEASGGDQINYISIPYEGTAVNNDIVIDGVYLDSPITIKKISVNARTAPTGANLTVDLTKSGSVQSRTATLTASSTFETTDITDTGISPGERLGVKVTGVGSTVAGESLQIILQYTHDRGDTGTQYLPLLYYGLAQNSDDIINGFTPNEKLTVAKADLFVRDAPTGANLTVDLLKNDSVQSRTMTLHDGYTYQGNNIKDDPYTTSDSLGMRLTGIGSTFVGESVLVMLHTANISTFASSFMSAFEGPLTIGTGDYNTLTGFVPADGSLYVSGSFGVSGVAYLEGGTAWTSADIAEAYPTLDATIEAGDLVTIATDSARPVNQTNPNGSPAYVKKTTTAYDKNILGVISTKPAGVMGMDRSASSSAEIKVPVALIGRVPVKIDPDSPAIEVGDFLTSSDKPGFAQKATKAGYTIGKALKSWSPGGPDRIEVFVNLGYHDPDIYLTDTGDLKIDINNENQYQLTNGQVLINRIGAYAQLVAANIRAGYVHAQALTVAGYIQTKELIAATVETEKLVTKIISPLPGEAIYIEGPVEIAGDASISGTLTAGEINSSTIDKLREKIEALTSNLTSEVKEVPTSEVVIDVNTLNAIYELMAANDATDSAQYANLAFIEAEGAYFSDYLAVLGQATITNLQVTNQITLAKINGLNGSVDLAGNLNVYGDLTVTGNVNILGELTAPTAGFSSLLAQTLTAEKAKIDKLTTSQLIIASPADSTSEVKEVPTSEVSTPSASIKTNATAGKAILPGGSTELTINSPHVDASSLVYVTPTGDPQNQVLYVKAKKACPEEMEGSDPSICAPWFRVAINQPLPYDLEFNWWIIKLE